MGSSLSWLPLGREVSYSLDTSLAHLRANMYNKQPYKLTFTPKATSSWREPTWTQAVNKGCSCSGLLTLDLFNFFWVYLTALLWVSVGSPTSVLLALSFIGLVAFKAELWSGNIWEHPLFQLCANCWVCTVSGPAFSDILRQRVSQVTGCHHDYTSGVKGPS